MNIWIIGAGLLLRFILQFTKVPFPEHYTILSLSPQNNATKALEVVHQHSIGVTNYPSNSVCHSDLFLWGIKGISYIGPHISLFLLLLIAEVLLGYMLSHPILRRISELSNMKAQYHHHKEKKSLRVFIVFYYLPFTLAASYFHSLKIIDYSMILAMYWFSLKEFTLLSATLMGFLAYYNPLYIDLALVPLLVLKGKGLKEKAKFCVWGVLAWAGFKAIEYLLRLQNGTFPCKNQGLFVLNDLAPQLSIFWYWNLEIFERYRMLLNNVMVLAFFGLSVPLYLFIEKCLSYAKNTQYNKYSTQLLMLLLAKSYFFFPNSDMTDLGVLLALLYASKKHMRNIEFAIVLLGTYTIVAVYGYFNVWYKKGGNANMLFFQGLVFKIAISFAFMNIIWNTQKWLEKKKTTKFVKEDIIGPIIDATVATNNPQ